MADVTGTNTIPPEQVALRDAKGRWLSPPPGNRAITSDTARDMVRLREEKRMRLYAEGAQRAVQDVQLIREYGEDAHIVERGMTLQIISSTADAGKAAVMAAAHLDKAQGLIVDRADSSTPARVEHVLDERVMALLERIAGIDTVDGTVTDVLALDE